jgi:peptidylprolyl isomerase
MQRFSTLARLFALCVAAAAPAVGRGADTAPAPPTPATVPAGAPASDWAPLDPDDLLVMDLANGGRVVIALADGFAPVHVGNIRVLARTHWYDGLVIERVQDNYVVQWGDPAGKKPLPNGITRPTPAEYSRAAEGVRLAPLPFDDTYASRVGLWGVFPVGESGGEAWLVHCYGMVGVGRDLSPDTGTGAELYAVIGQPPRALDRNIAVVGRVLSGVELLAALPRGQGDLGFYANPAQRLPIRSIRLASELPAAQRPSFEALVTSSPTFRAWIQVKANRQDKFFLRPAGALDVCNALPPVRPAPKR